MKRYQVSVIVDASISIIVEAENEKEAKEKAMDEASRPNICHQCSRELEVGDPIKATEALEIES